MFSIMSKQNIFDLGMHKQYENGRDVLSSKCLIEFFDNGIISINPPQKFNRLVFQTKRTQVIFLMPPHND